MKKLIILFLPLLLLGGSSQAQDPTVASTPRNGWPKADKRFYFDLQGGYGFRMGSGYTGFLRFDEFQTCMPFEKEQEAKEIKNTLGEGWQGGLNFGYHFNRYMAIEVGVCYIESGFSASQLFPCDTSGHLFMLDKPCAMFHYDYFSIITLSDDFDGHIGNLHVALRLSPGFQRWDPYLKMGVELMVGVVNHDIRAELGNLYHNTDSYEQTDFDWGGFGRSGQERLTTTAVGFTAAFGINCHFTPTISMFAEWQFTLMSSVSYRDHWIEADNIWGNVAYRHVLDNAIGEEYIGVGTFIRRDFVLPFSNTGLNIGLKFAF